MRAPYIVLFLIFVFFKSYSQEKYLSGTVVDEITGVPLKKVNITIYSDKLKIGDFTTDSLGDFQISTKLISTSNLIEIKFSDYQSIRVRLDSRDIIKNNNLGEFQLKPTGINLNEVIIRRKQRYRDTIQINLLDKKIERSTMIDDLFSKELGFYKDKTGLLYFKGKLVSDIEVNGGDFFGKNNRDIYKNLPALILNHIEIIETDIDSVTNVTQLKPIIKVNLKFKDKYDKGKFGNLNLGIGTLKRYIGAVNLYAFKRNQQISFAQNSNNINIVDSFSGPILDFSGTTNNKVSNNIKFAYRDLFYKNKIELSANVNLNLSTIKFNSETYRKDEILNQFSTISNSSNSKNIGLNGVGLIINYKINPLSSLKLEEYLTYNSLTQRDNLGYNIERNEVSTKTFFNKNRVLATRSILSSLLYQKRSPSKQGRVLNSNYILESNSYNVNEINDQLGDPNYINKNILNNGQRLLLENRNSINLDFTEPLGERMLVTLFAKFRIEIANQDTEAAKKSQDDNRSLNNVILRDYFIQGVRFYRNFGKITIDFSSFNNIGRVNINDKDAAYGIWNLDGKMDLNFKLSKNRNLSAYFTRKIDYPSVTLLTANNRSFDLISQEVPNLTLRPELKNTFQIAYDLIKTDSINLAFDGKIERYKSKFGFNIAVLSDNSQVMYNDNVGGATNANIGIILSRGNNFNYDFRLAYVENPSILDRQYQLNANLGFQQTISFNKNLFRNIMSISPSIFTSFSRFRYQSNSGNQLNLVYRDNMVFNCFNIEFNLSPLINYTYIIKHNVSFALNTEVKKSFLKKYGSAWLKVYDVFNSFKYFNNFNTPTYIQSTTYSNLNRYFLLGVSMKFNNMR